MSSVKLAPSPPTIEPFAGPTHRRLRSGFLETGFEFNANGVLVSVGRILGHDDSDEANFAKRVDGDVVVWVKASDAALRRCLLDSTTYSVALDQRDES